MGYKKQLTKILSASKGQEGKGIKLDDLEEFKSYREHMNARILSANNLGIKRFFALDSRAYEKGVLDVKTKELLGLVASTVLRCNDCITYHVIRCVQEDVSDQEFFEALNIALIVGGSITIPHIRRAVDVLDQCRKKQLKGQIIRL
jgi:AhpD family alkylhydroperoxidase